MSWLVVLGSANGDRVLRVRRVVNIILARDCPLEVCVLRLN